MGTCILCQISRAEVPYYLSPIRMNIYSIEELCYFLVNNLYLADGTVFNDGLADWLENELGLSSLASKLRPKFGKYADIQELIYPVLKEINYLTYDEIKTFNARIAAYNSESYVIRARKKGDTLVKNGILVDAIRVYQDALARLESTEPGTYLPESDLILTPVLYHNLGCAWARLFQMEKAVECFFSAYRWTGSDEDLKTYLLAYRCVRTPIEYQSRLTELQAGEEVLESLKSSLDEFKRKPEPVVYARDLDEVLTGLTAEYHRSTGS